MHNLNMRIGASLAVFSALAILPVNAEQKINLYKINLTKSELKAFALDKQGASSSRLTSANLGYDEFRERVFKEPFEGGLYIVNGDTTVESEKELEAFFEKEIFLEWPSTKFGALIVNTEKGRIAGWDNIQKTALTYCVSKEFGARYNTVVLEMANATAAWETESNIDYIHVQKLDDNCTRNTNDVVFDVRPVDVGGKYLARAFFPNYARVNRNILIDSSAFNHSPNSKLTLTGILRHELGHTLGFRHEHTRPESGACFEDNNWIPLGKGEYDGFSVMHYPQCNGLSDWTLTLSEQDKLGVACLYGPHPGVTFDSGVCSVN